MTQLRKAIQSIIITLILSTAPSSSSLAQSDSVRPPCCNDFNDFSLHGWNSCPERSAEADIALRSPGPSGAPDDFYLSVQSDSSAAVLCSGTECVGDWTTLASSGCASLCFDIRMDNDGVPGVTIDPLYPYVYLWSGQISAVFVANKGISEPGGANAGWHRVCAPIALLSENELPKSTDGLWRMHTGSNADWNKLLANVTRVEVPTNFSIKTGLISYDNFCLITTDCPSTFVALCIDIEGDEFCAVFNALDCNHVQLELGSNITCYDVLLAARSPKVLDTESVAAKRLVGPGGGAQLVARDRLSVEIDANYRVFAFKLDASGQPYEKHALTDLRPLAQAQPLAVSGSLLTSPSAAAIFQQRDTNARRQDLFIELQILLLNPDLTIAAQQYEVFDAYTMRLVDTPTGTSRRRAVRK